MDILSVIGTMLEKGLWAGAVVLIVVVMMERLFKERVAREREFAEQMADREKEVAEDLAAYLERCNRREDVLIAVVKENTDTMASVRTLIELRLGKTTVRKKMEPAT